MSIPGSNSNYELLRNAIRKKDRVAARYLVRLNVDVNFSNAKGNTLLHWAIIKFDDLHIMTMLLDRGANIHAKNHHNHEPIEVAIRNNKTEAVQLLIKRGTFIRKNLYTFILMAIEKNNDTMVKILIDHGIQNDILNDLKCFLNVAISRGQTKIIEHILPHYQFLTPSDKYIPREVVIKSGPEYKECFELLLKWNFTVNPNSNSDKDFVYAAVEKGYLSIVLQLLKFGFDVNMMNTDTGLNLLQVACFNNHYEIVENLLQHNVCVNVTTPIITDILNHKLGYLDENNPLLPFIHSNINLHSITCLHIAVLNSDLKMTRLLLSYGATVIDDPTFFNVTGIAVHNNCEEIVRIFLACGVNVNNIDSDGKSLLHICVLPTCDSQDSRYNITELLLEKGAAIHIQTPRNSLLFEAITNGYHKTAQLFLDYNADIQYISLDGNSLLHEAIGHNFDVEFIKTLLKRNLPVNATNKSMLTPLLVACKIKPINQVEIIKALLDYNANVHCTDNNLMTPLHFTYRAQNLEFVTALLQKGANLNATNIKGRTPLHLSCKYKTNMTQSIIELLLKHHANIEAMDANGWTPLFVACKAGNDLAVKCLLENHANANHTDLEKLTPLFIAAKHCGDDSKIVKILLEHKVNVHCMDKFGDSVIHVVVDQDNLELIKCLAHTQINFNSVNKDGDTPLHIAVHKESIEMTKELIKYGTNLNIVDNKNRTPLKVAVDYMSDCRNERANYHDCFYWRGKSWRSSEDEDEDIDICRSQLSLYEEITEILKIQVIKLTVAGLKVNNLNLNIAHNLDDNGIRTDGFSNKDHFDYKNTKTNILQLEVECEHEIERMKTESIGVDNMTFHDLLTKNIHLLSTFVKNKKIRQTLYLETYDAKFPLYMDIVRNRFRDAKFRYIVEPTRVWLRQSSAFHLKPYRRRDFRQPKDFRANHSLVGFTIE